MENTQIIEVLRQGVRDEMNAAFQYIGIAGLHGDGELKQAFLSYAADELHHAEKLLTELRQRQGKAEEFTLQVGEWEDLFAFLIEYMAHEESAIFYYDTLAALTDQKELQKLCREIGDEERLHLQQMENLYQKLKHEGYHG